MKKILVTGAAGFIGFHLINRLEESEYEVIGLDNINDYYDPSLKFDRLKVLGFDAQEIEFNKLIPSSKKGNLSFVRMNLEDSDAVMKLFEEQNFHLVCHLGAQAGVRYSLENPQAYIDSNITGTLSILEACRKYPVEHLAYASSSSVYGMNKKMPLSVTDGVDHPVSLYAASKKSTELFAHTYSHLYGIPTTGLRFFTVYGPWGRPDMAFYIFTKAILEGKPIKVYNNGDMYRDFTYIDDIIEGVYRVINKTATPDKGFDVMDPDPSVSSAAYRIYNIGNTKPVKLLDFIEAIEKITGKKAIKEFHPIQPGDVLRTESDVERLKTDMGYQPNTDIHDGMTKFVKWFMEYYNY